MGIYRPWLIGVTVWLGFSLVVSFEYLQSARSDHLFELTALMGLLWVQFGFAGLFHTLRKERGRNAIPLLLVTLIPPLILLIVNFSLAWCMGKPAVLPWPWGV